MVNVTLAFGSLIRQHHFQGSNQRVLPAGDQVLDIGPGLVQVQYLSHSISHQKQQG